MKLFVRIRYSHALRLVPSWNPANPRIRAQARCPARGPLRRRGCASSAGRREYRLGSSGMTSRSNRSRSAGSSSGGACCAVDTPSTVPRGRRSTAARSPSVADREPAHGRLSYLAAGGKMACHGGRRRTSTEARPLGAATAQGPGLRHAAPEVSARGSSIPILLLVLIVFNCMALEREDRPRSTTPVHPARRGRRRSPAPSRSRAPTSPATYDDERRGAGLLDAALAELQSGHRRSRDFLEANGVQYKFTQPSVLASLADQHPAVRAGDAAHLLLHLPADGRGRRTPR